MANEELVQRGYLSSGKLKGDKFGDFERFNVGGTNAKEFVTSGLSAVIPKAIVYPFKVYKPPKNPGAVKPDAVYAKRKAGHVVPIAVMENKAPSKFVDEKANRGAAEQAFFAAKALGAKVAITTNGARYVYINVLATEAASDIIFFDEKRDLNPAVLENLLAGDAGEAKDPKPLAETVWQIIWHATKAEPKECLLTFVEIFLLKFLSDNLPQSTLPSSYSFYTLLSDPKLFVEQHGTTAIEYYVSTIRPKIKTLFPDNVVVQDENIPTLFGLSMLVSKTSIINGFAFLRSSTETLATFNRTFLEILEAFNTFGPLTSIDPEFKLRLYETFLRRSARQQKLGQFFTPRNVVRPMIRMARLGKLPKGSVVLDPAAGVGGFVLEPLLFPDALPKNVTFAGGQPIVRVRTIGVDVDANVHILAKANMLIHMAEQVRDPAITMAALNSAMANTFVLMNANEPLGSLENPPRGTIDVILTNPPYVTQGSAIYKNEIREVKGTRNGVDLRDYYDGSGLGVEALFLRYIAGALKPGGRGFVIVPLGLLNRTESRPKERLLEECDVVASIQLPRNSFFNTSQKTYILVLEKRHTSADVRPAVFCAIARSIGESLDWRRIPHPHDNDLDSIATAFIDFVEGKTIPPTNRLVKIRPASDFSANDRWDVTRFWSDDELVKLGEKDSPVDRLSFIDDTRETIGLITTELAVAKSELTALTSTPMTTVFLSDPTAFKVRSGDRITTDQVRKNPGDVPVYSCFKDAKITKGLISESFLKKYKLVIETKPLVTVNANGASVGKVYFRNERCTLTDDVIAVDVLREDIDPEYFAIALRTAVAQGGFLYEAKLFAGRVRELAVDIPVKSDGTFDLAHQRSIAAVVKRFESIRQQMAELGTWSANARIM